MPWELGHVEYILTILDSQLSSLTKWFGGQYWKNDKWTPPPEGRFSNGVTCVGVENGYGWGGFHTILQKVIKEHTVQ